jgi:TRAP-type C4-dicarboxylate transport system substrate-binding protein
LEKLENEFGLKVLSFMWVQGFRHFMTNKPIKSPDDLKGLRIRTPGAPIWQESVRALGATPVALSFGEMYSALQSKAIDGCELVYANIVGGNLYEVLKYSSETGHILLINFEVTSAKWFNSLPPEYQQIVVEECDKAGLETSRKIMEQLEEEHKQTCIEKGMEIVTDIDVKAFIKAGDKAYEALDLMDAKKTLFKEMGKTVE